MRPRPLALILGAGTLAGGELAQQLVRRGFDLLLCDPNGDILLALREKFTSSHVLVQLFQGDLANPRHRGELLQFLRLANAKPDVVVLVTGRLLRERRLAASAAEMRQVLESQVLALDDLLRGGLLAGMLGEGNGFVLVLGAATGLVPIPGMALSSAAGHWQRAYMDALREELAGSGIRLSQTLCAAGYLASLEPGNGDLGSHGLKSRSKRLAHVAVNGLFAGRALSICPRWRGTLLRMLAMLPHALRLRCGIRLLGFK